MKRKSILILILILDVYIILQAGYFIWDIAQKRKTAVVDIARTEEEVSSPEQVVEKKPEPVKIVEEASKAQTKEVSSKPETKPKPKPKPKEESKTIELVKDVKPVPRKPKPLGEIKSLEPETIAKSEVPLTSEFSPKPKSLLTKPSVTSTAKEVTQPAEDLAAVKVVKKESEKETAAEKKTLKNKNILVMDDFDDGSVQNDFGGFTGSFRDGGTCTESLYSADISKVYGNAGASLKLVYDVSKRGSYSGYWSRLKEANLEPYRYLSFNVRGDIEKIAFKIELGDGSKRSKITSNTFFIVTTSWQKVKVPLEVFREITDWESMRGSFAILFENRLGEPYNGTLYIDNLAFE